MNAREIINEIANSREYKDLCKNIAKGSNRDLHEDLFQEVILILLQKEPEQIEKLHSEGGLRYYVVGIAQNQFRSDSSKFYKDHLRFSQKSTELKEIEQDSEIKEDSLKDIVQIIEVSKTKEQGDFKDSNDWYTNEIFKLYLQEGSYRKLEAKIAITRNTIGLTIKKFKEEAQEKLKIKAKFMKKEYFRIPDEVKEQIFENALLKGMDPEELLVQQLVTVNRAMKIKRTPKPGLNK